VAAKVDNFFYYAKFSIIKILFLIMSLRA